MCKCLNKKAPLEKNCWFKEGTATHREQENEDNDERLNDEITTRK